MNESPASAFARFIDAAFHVKDVQGMASGAADDLASKLRLVERLVELTRFERGLDPFAPVAHNPTLGEVAHLSARMDMAGLHLHPGVSRPLPPAKRATDLQAPLLVFLLVQETPRPPMATICALLEEIRPVLSPLDAERTATGKQRAYTNTSFAAEALRDYGLLRYTHEEAFKRWALSPLGTLVAIRLYRKHWAKTLIVPEENAVPGLQRSITDILRDLATPDGFSTSAGLVLEVRGLLHQQPDYADALVEGFRAVHAELPGIVSAGRSLPKAERQKKSRRLADALEGIDALRRLLDDVRLDAEARERLSSLQQHLANRQISRT